MKLFELLEVADCDYVDVRDYRNEPLFYGKVEDLMEDKEVYQYSECTVLYVTPKTKWGGEQYLEINIH